MTGRASDVKLCSKKSMMESSKDGQDVARCISWGSSPPLEKTQGEGNDCSLVADEPRSVVHSIDDGNTPEGPRRSLNKIKLATWNVGSMSGKSGEIAEVMIQRKIDVCCVQETKWKGRSNRWLAGGQIKFYWVGCESGNAGVGILLKKWLADNVTVVNKINERIMNIKVVIGKDFFNLLSIYAPQSGRSKQEKDTFWKEVEDVVRVIPMNERTYLCGDFNAHIGKNADGFEGVHGGYGYGSRNNEGLKMLEVLDALDMTICNTWFKKDDDAFVTYASGNRSSCIDMFVVRSQHRKEVQNVKVIKSEVCVSQHHLVVAEVVVKMKKKRKRKWTKKIKIWKLKQPAFADQFKENLDAALCEPAMANDCNGMWNEFKDKIVMTSEDLCGRTCGPPRHKETWWWNDDISKVVDEKKEAYKKFKESIGTSNENLLRRDYNVVKRKTKKMVSAAISKQRKGFVDKINDSGSKNNIFRVARQMAKKNEDVTSVNCMKNSKGEIVVGEENLIKVWKDYMEKLLNEENEWDGVCESDKCEGPIAKIDVEEVRKSVGNNKEGKASATTEVVTEMLNKMGDNGMERLCEIYNVMLETGEIPEDFTRSVLCPIYKGKGDPLLGGSYRGIKLLEHAMKVFERIVERRIRDEVKIDPMQFGFMPGKGTTDGIFLVRQLQEKALRKNNKLFLGFVDLEKAFDRVPRKVVEWALRKEGVNEYMVKAVMSMYRDAKTAVKVGNMLSQEFEVKVGLHQGSVLSPLLFIIVMQAISKHTKIGLPWELLYADDLAIVSKTEMELNDRMIAWKNCLESKGLKVNLTKTKVMCVRKRKDRLNIKSEYPCGVCSKNVKLNSILCTCCKKWVHKRCSKVRGGITARVASTYICPACIKEVEEKENPCFSTDGIVLGDFKLEEVTEFCYLGDTINSGGGNDIAAIRRVRSGWKKFRELSPMLTLKEMPLKQRSKLYTACVRSKMIYGSETWAMNTYIRNLFESTEMRMLRWMMGVTMKDKMRSEDIRRHAGVENIHHVIRRNRLRWYGHVQRKDENDWVKSCMNIEFDGIRGVGRPVNTWEATVKDDMKAMNIDGSEWQDRKRWRALIHGDQQPG